MLSIVQGNTGQGDDGGWIGRDGYVLVLHPCKNMKMFFKEKNNNFKQLNAK
jgi:hypothetical protein